MAALNKIATPVGQPPPDVPSTIQQPLGDYLRRFGMWAAGQLQAKVPIQTAIPGFLIMSANGSVFKIVVSDTGVLATQPIAPGSTLQ